MSPSFCRELHIYFNSVTCGSWADSIRTVFLMAYHLDTCTLSLPLTLSFLSFPRLPSTAPVPTPESLSPLRTAPHHLRTYLPRCVFLMYSVSESIIMANRKGLKADPWWSPTSTAKGSLVPAGHLTTVSHCWYMSFTSLILLWRPLVSHAPIQLFPRNYVVGFSRSMNIQCKSCCPSLCLSCNCLSAKIASVVDVPFTNPNCSSLMLTMFLSRFSCTLSYSFML